MAVRDTDSGAELARDRRVDLDAARDAGEVHPFLDGVGASPAGPKTIVGMLAEERSAESAQNGTPTISGPPAWRETSSAITSSAGVSNG